MWYTKHGFILFMSGTAETGLEKCVQKAKLKRNYLFPQKKIKIRGLVHPDTVLCILKIYY